MAAVQVMLQHDIIRREARTRAGELYQADVSSTLLWFVTEKFRNSTIPPPSTAGATIVAKRLLHLLSQRPMWTGSGVALEAIVDLAAQSGWTQRVVVGTPSDDPAPAVGNLQQHSVLPLLFGTGDLPFPLPGMSDVMPYPSSRFSALTTGQLAAYRDGWRKHLTAVLSQFSPDVIHAHHLWLLSAMVKDVAGNVPVIVHCHATGLRQRKLCPHLAEEVRRGCRRNDRFLVLHNGDARHLQEEMTIDKRKIHVVGSGFREETFHPHGRVKQPGPVIVYAGKLSNAKGVPALITAVERLSVRMPNLVLHVAGSGVGDEATAIEKQMRISAARIIFHGQLSQPSLANLCRSAALFVLPSFYEGLPLVLVEAAACGCRLVATALPGVVEELVPLLGDLLQLVPLPPMEHIDQPATSALPEFIGMLERTMESALQKPPVNPPGERLREATWAAVFQRVQTVWKEVTESPLDRSAKGLRR